MGQQRGMETVAPILYHNFHENQAFISIFEDILHYVKKYYLHFFVQCVTMSR